MKLKTAQKTTRSESVDWSDMSVLVSHQAQSLSQRLLSVPSDLALALATSPWVERHWLEPRYQSAIHRHQLSQQPNGERLPSLDQRIVNDLRNEGVSITHLDQLQLADPGGFWYQAQAIASELSLLAKQPGYRQRHTLNASREQLLRYPEVVKWGLAERILRIVEHYIGLPVAYDGPSFYYSLANSQTGGPRKWHRDKEDWRMIKVTIYLNDVDSLGGPYEILEPRLNTWLCQQVPPYQTFLDRQLEQVISKPLSDCTTTCLGSAGTVIFSDTAHYYHHGRPPVAQDRAAIFFSYFSQRPKHPFFCSRSALSQPQLRRFASGLSDRQRAALLWKDSLPFPQRYIPQNCVKV